MSESTLVQRIIERYKGEFLGPFPLGDVKKLRSIDSDNLELFHGRLEMFLASIAGYASGADHLDRRPKKELIEAREALAQSFFVKNSSLSVYREGITEQLTPSLSRELATAEALRRDLLTLIEHILSRP